MAYPNFGKVKTIVLPVPRFTKTYEEYKKTYGIDLANLLVNQGVYFELTAPNTQILFDASEMNEDIDNSIMLYSPSSITHTEYKSGDSDFSLACTLNTGAGLLFVMRIDKNKEFSIENLVIEGNK